MKKYLIISLLAFVPFLAKADTLFGFMNGSFYNVTGQLQAFCFMDNSCFDIQGKQVWNDNGNFVSTQPIGSTIPVATSSPITITPSQNNQVVIIPQQPIQQIIVTQPTPQPTLTTPLATTTMPQILNVQLQNNGNLNVTYDTNENAHSFFVMSNDPSLDLSKITSGSDGGGEQTSHWGTIGLKNGQFYLNGGSYSGFYIIAVDSLGNRAYTREYTINDIP